MQLLLRRHPLLPQWQRRQQNAQPFVRIFTPYNPLRPPVAAVDRVDDGTRQTGRRGELGVGTDTATTFITLPADRSGLRLAVGNLSTTASSNSHFVGSVSIVFPAAAAAASSTTLAARRRSETDTE
jgi:hypothetical protein